MLSRSSDIFPEPMPNYDPLNCPLCGRPNQCGQADPASRDLPCWCFSAQIDRQALERIPEAARGRSCLCLECARSAAGTATNRSG